MEAYPWVVGDYDFDPQELQASKKRPIASHGVACQVEGCMNDLSGLRPFYQRLRICEAHAKAHSVTDGSGIKLRFCQQCSKLQPIDAFEYDRRSCVASLHKRRARRTVGSKGAKGKCLPDDLATTSSDQEQGGAAARANKRQARGRLENGSSGSSAGSGGRQATQPSPLKSRLGGAGSPGSVGGGRRERGGSGTSSDDGIASLPDAELEAGPQLPGLQINWQAAALATAQGNLHAPMLAASLFGGAGASLPHGLQAAQQPASMLLAHLQQLGGTQQQSQQQQQQQQGAQQQAQLAGDLSILFPSDIDMLLQLHPEELADCLLDIHSYEPDSDISNLAALAAELGLPALAALDPLVGQSSASRLSHETASAGALQPPSQHLLPPAQHQHSPQVQAPGHSAGSGVAQVPEGSPRTAQLGFVTAGMPAQMMGSTGALGNSASSLETPGPPPALSVGSLRAAPLQGMEYEDHLVTFAFKLFDTTPDHLPAELRAQLQTAISLAPTVMHASMRTGCVCLITTALLSRAEVERLEGGGAGGLPGAVAASVAKAHPSTRILCQSGSRLSAADGRTGRLTHIQLPGDASSACAQLAAPQLAMPVVLCGGSSETVRLVLKGRGIASPAATLHCRSRGHHVVVTVLQASRASSSSSSGGGSTAAAGNGRANLEEPGTPPPADRHSVDSDGEWSATEEADLGPSGAAPAGASRAATPTAAELAFGLVDVAAGEDALLVELPAPAGGWGLFELEVASGPLLSAPAPLLVLPSWAAEAADELAELPSTAEAGGFDATSFLQHMGFLLHTAEQQSEPGARPLESPAVQRVTRLARHLAAMCAAHDWLATARLLLPALGLGGSSSGSSNSAAAAAGRAGKHGWAAAAVEAALRGSKSASDAEQAQLQALLARLTLQEAEEEGQPLPRQLGAPQWGLRAELADQLADWFWAGANVAAGAACLALLLRSSLGDGATL